MSSSILHDCSTIIKGNAESFRQLSHLVHGGGARQETGTRYTPVGAIHESPASLPFHPSLPPAKGGGGVADGGIVTKLRDNPSVTCRLRMFFGFAREIVGVQPTKKNSARRFASRTAHPLHRGAEDTNPRMVRRRIPHRKKEGFAPSFLFILRFSFPGVEFSVPPRPSHRGICPRASCRNSRKSRRQPRR